MFDVVVWFVVAVVVGLAVALGRLPAGFKNAVAARLRLARFLHKEGPEKAREDAKEALRRIVDARLCPPDTVSAGECRGGPAIFFKHDEAQEVFIGRTYDHAADEFIEWLTRQRSGGERPKTATVTQLNRATRRAMQSRRRPNLATTKRTK